MPLEGATNATYPIINAQPTNAGNYSVIVSNPYGSATSGVATVTVVFPPSITLSPLSQSVAAGTSLTLGVVASGTAPLSYQWFNSLGPIAGATNFGYTLNPVQTNHTDSYAVMVSNPYGVVTSAVATLFVYVPVSITAQPSSQAVPARSTVSLSVVAGGYPAPAYQWRFRGSDLLGATSSTLTITNVLLPNTGDYTVLVDNGYSSELSTPAMRRPSASSIWSTRGESASARSSPRIWKSWTTIVAPSRGASAGTSARPRDTAMA